MGIFEMFSPEKILEHMGIKPAELLAEYEKWAAEFIAMKTGAKNAGDYFRNRCDALETKIDRIENKLEKFILIWEQRKSPVEYNATMENLVTHKPHANGADHDIGN
jgi:hypothetical protein